MLPRATKILKVIGDDLSRREKVLEIDQTLTRIRYEIIIGRHSGDPVKILYDAHSDTDLTAK